MFAVTLYAGLHLRSLTINLLVLTALGGLALLFWRRATAREPPDDSHHHPHSGDGIGPKDFRVVSIVKRRASM